MNPYPANPLPPSPPSPPAVLTQEERTWAMIIHLSAFAGHFLPIAHLLAPLIIWQIKRETSAFLDDQGKEAVNAQLTVTIYGLVAAVLCIILIGIPLLIGLWVADVILVIVAAIAANGGQAYRYPGILRLIK